MSLLSLPRQPCQNQTVQNIAQNTLNQFYDWNQNRFGQTEYR